MLRIRFEFGGRRLERRREPEVRPRALQSGGAESPAVPRRGTADQSFEVADDVIVRRQHFEVRHARGQAHELRKSAADLVVAQVMENIRADDEVERLRETERRQLVEAGAVEIALAAEARDGVLARVDAEIANART